MVAASGALLLDLGAAPSTGVAPPPRARPSRCRRRPPHQSRRRNPTPSSPSSPEATSSPPPGPHLGPRGAERLRLQPLLAGTDAWIAGADLALCHLEVPLTVPGQRPAGYPTFVADAHLAIDLREQGWDGCSTASNHSMDQGESGVVSTLEALDAAGLGHVGTARSEAEAAVPALYVLERAGREIVVAHLSATYGTNGVPIPASAPGR
ncbi:CapA family protein [Oerskovia sp. M15]